MQYACPILILFLGQVNWNFSLLIDCEGNPEEIVPYFLCTLYLKRYKIIQASFPYNLVYIIQLNLYSPTMRPKASLVGSFSQIFIFLIHKDHLLFHFHSLLGFQSLEKLREQGDSRRERSCSSSRTRHGSPIHSWRQREDRNTHPRRLNSRWHSATQARKILLF